MIKFHFSVLPLLFLANLLSAGLGATQPSHSPAELGQWSAVPEEAVLKPSSPFVSDCFSLISSESDSIHLAFRCKSREGELPGNGERFRCVVVAPPGGIKSVTCEGSAPVLLKGGQRVLNATPPETISFNDRLNAESIGEYRGARLIQVEFRPVTTLSGIPGVDSALIETATIHLFCASPFATVRPVNPLLIKTLSPFVVNAEDLPCCLHPRASTGQPPIPPAWFQPALKIRTSREGWHSIPAEQVIEKLGKGIPFEALTFTCRAPLFSLETGTNLDAGQETGINPHDLKSTLFLQRKNKEDHAAGPLEPGDEIIFYAPATVSPTDPKECFWLSSGGLAPQPPDTPPEPATGLPVHATGVIHLRIGEDRVFAEGGERTLQQARFWVDQAFENDRGNEIHIPLPPLWAASSQPVQGSFNLLFGSSLKEGYSQEDSLKQDECAIMAGDSTCAYVQSSGKDEIGIRLQFTLEAGKSRSPLAIKYQPADKPRNPLYLDSLELSMSQPLIWQGTNCAYSWPGPVPGVFRIQAPPELSPPMVFALQYDGEWLRLEPQREGSFLQVVSLHPIRELHLAGEFQPVDNISLYHPPQWLAQHPQADQLVISPTVFKEQLNQLIEMDNQRGFKSAWIDLEQIFDLFSGGQFSPFGLRNFLGWVEKNWADPQPFSVLLAGDSTWDFWDRFALNGKVPNWTPSLHTDIHPDFPNDLWFIEGAPNDRIGNWFLGRIPCQTVRHLEDYLSKRKRQVNLHSRQSPTRIVWVTDDNPPFEKHSTETFHQSLPLSRRLDHIRVRDYPFVDNFYYGIHLSRIREEARKASAPLDYGKISPECNQAVRASLSQGASLFIYFGHSGLNVLGHERILFGGGSKFSDIPSLTNQDCCPLAFMMTCDVGRFDFVEIPKWSVGLAEELLFSPHGGCLGLVTSSGRGLPSDHLALLKSCLDLHVRAGIGEFGAILWGGKIQCLLAGMPNQAVEMFNLFGDPLEEVQSLPSLLLLPQGLKWNPDGSLAVRFSLPEDFRQMRVKACWQVGDDMREDFSWNQPEQISAGVYEVTLPEARDLKKLLLGAFIESASAPSGMQAGWLGIDLEDIPRPGWNDPQPSGLPNLVVSEDRIHFEKDSPRSGETIFIQASVVNSGTATARDVRVAAFSNDDKPLPNFANYPGARIERLSPGEEKRVRLRWDLWEGTGLKEIVVKADPEKTIAETDENDNAAHKSIRILEKADLGWGLIRETTEAHVDFSRIRPVPASWVADPTHAELGSLAAFRALLAPADRAAILEVPLCNFGETRSVTCSLLYRYWGEDESGKFFETDAPRIAPLLPVAHPLNPKAVPVLLVPGVRRIELEIDPDGIVDETTRANNILTIVPPATLWDGLPMQHQKRTFPEALRRF